MRASTILAVLTQSQFYHCTDLPAIYKPAQTGTPLQVPFGGSQLFLKRKQLIMKLFYTVV